MKQASRPLDYDVLIVGAGPAGACAALNLAPHCRVLIIDRDTQPVARIGESLIPAARRLFHDMGILQSFTTQNHATNYGNRAFWGLPKHANTPFETDFLRDPDGPGWHIDRVQFERLLRDTAQQRGAHLKAGYKLVTLNFIDQAWQVRLQSAEQSSIELHVGLILDASGRAAAVARLLGAKRHKYDQLVCGWLYGEVAQESAAFAGFSTIESAAAGWWYSAPLPNQRRVLAFHTDADLTQASIAKSTTALFDHAQQLPGIGPLLAATNFQASTAAGYTAAHSMVLQPAAGRAWLALGDAALCFDPLSSQGLFKALYTAFFAAQVARQYLSGQTSVIQHYIAVIKQIEQAYYRQLAHWYNTEQRWSGHSFWQRRQT